MSKTILDLKGYVTLARELSISGDYETSLAKYKTALNIIAQRKLQINKVSLRDQWTQVEKMLKTEIELINEAINVAKTFQNSDLSRVERAINEEGIHNRQREPSNPEDLKNKENVVGLNRRKGVDKNKGKGVNDKGNKAPVKPPVKQPVKGPIKQPPGKKVNPLPPKGRGSAGGKKEEEKKDPKSGKSPFYLHHYPEGEGPDGELIEMVEREVMDRSPNVNFDDIAGLENAKDALREAVLLPLLMPDFFRGVRRPWKGVLLYGPPGTGKTLLAKALATQGKTTFFNVSPTTFASKWKGESEKLVRILFEMARFYAPSTVFIDEVDSMGQKRGDGDSEASRKVLAEMLVQMDGASGKIDREDLSDEELKKNMVMVMGATNLPWDLDEAFRRRFEKRIYIPLPNAVGRKQMFYINMKGVKVEHNINLDLLVQKTEGYSGADIANVCREASLMQMRRVFNQKGRGLVYSVFKANKTFVMNELDAPITQDDFLQAIKNIPSSVAQSQLVRYEEFTKDFANT